MFATRGELGTPVEGVLAEGEQLALRRTAECYRSAEVLGVSRVEFLGYVDSGSIGETTHDDPWTFWRADVDHAANRLAAVLREESADLLTTYDDHGGYGHPDHIQVHRVGRRAAELASVPLVAQATSNREMVQGFVEQSAEGGLGDVIEAEELERTNVPDLPADFGTPVAQISHTVDATPVIAEKRASMLCHASQIGPDHFMATLPDELFGLAFGTEWFIVDSLDGSTTAGETLLGGLLQPNPLHQVPS